MSGKVPWSERGIAGMLPHPIEVAKTILTSEGDRVELKHEGRKGRIIPDTHNPEGNSAYKIVGVRGMVHVGYDRSSGEQNTESWVPRNAVRKIPQNK